MVIPKWEIVGHTSRLVAASKGQLVGRNSPNPGPVAGPSKEAVAAAAPKNGMSGKKTGSRMTSTSSAIPSAAISATSLARAGSSWSIDGPVVSLPHAPIITAQVKAPKRISVFMVALEGVLGTGRVAPGREDRRGPTRAVNSNERRIFIRAADHSFRVGSAVRVPPPETMNARVSAASAEMGSTWSAGTSTTRPAKLYDQGRYTAT